MNASISSSTAALEVSFAQNVFTFAEGDGSVSISVTKTGSHVSPVSVRVAGGEGGVGGCGGR